MRPSSSKDTFPLAGRLYLGAVIIAGFAVVLHSLYSLYARPVGPQWFVLAGLTLLSGSFTVRVPTIPARLSVSETFVFAAVLLFGPEAATMVVALDSLVISLWIFRSSRRPERVLFNFGAPAVAVWIASRAFYALAGIQPLAQASHSIFDLILPLVVLAVLYFLLNSWLIAIAVGLERKTSPFVVWRVNFLWLSLNYFSGASVAALLIPYVQGPHPQSIVIRVVGVLLPLLLISYLTLRTALGRVEDANRHLAELNKLYISTIETLAMAIDAKDQITHGHIRRVQKFAVGLARAMGINEGAQIQAVEAAALLHDMGKLAVPEYILNKPGPLTAAEFAKMKLHASVGADILSAIDFPYPVVPIVRHHHECWNGSGYPDGLKGSEIPIGARILSVVDCFDALTSDRPYRPRLSDAEALRILHERRGSMYDPLVVDTFTAVYRDIAPGDAEMAAAEPHAISAITRVAHPHVEASSRGGSRLDDISASTEEMLLLYELARSLNSRMDLPDAGDVVAKHLRRLVPATTCVFFVYNASVDELVSAYAAGENAGHFTGIRIEMGQRLTGWVAAHRQTIVNSDPMLDLGEVARALRPPLRSCLSTPLVAHDSLVGVLTLYSTYRDAFSEDHRRIVEVVARQVSETVQNAVDLRPDPNDNLSDPLTGLPNREDLDRFIASELTRGSRPCSILVLDIVQTSKGSIPTTWRVISKALTAARGGLRATDLVFRDEGDRFIVLLAQTEAAEADSLARQVASELSAGIFPDELARNLTAIRMGRATGPTDGSTLADLLRSAENRLVLRALPPRPSIH